MATSTVENYLKQLYLEQAASGDKMVPMGRLASAMGVVPGTATTMVKALADTGMVTYLPRTGVRLTSKGQQAALKDWVVEECSPTRELESDDEILANATSPARGAFFTVPKVVE